MDSRTLLDKIIQPLRLLQIIVALVIAAVITPVGAYYGVKLELSEKYVKKSDYSILLQKIDENTKLLYEIHGAIKSKKSN